MRPLHFAGVFCLLLLMKVAEIIANRANDDRLKRILELYNIVKPYKKTCSNITDSELKNVTELVNMYHAHFEALNLRYSRLRATGCQLPNTIRRVGDLLKGAGRI